MDLKFQKIVNSPHELRNKSVRKCLQTLNTAKWFGKCQKLTSLSLTQIVLKNNPSGIVVYCFCFLYRLTCQLLKKVPVCYNS